MIDYNQKWSLFSISRISCEIASNMQEDFNRGGIQVLLGFVCEKETNNQVFFNLNQNHPATMLHQRCNNAAPMLHQRCTNAAPMLHQRCTNDALTLHQRWKDIDIVLLFTLRLLFQILFYVSITVDPFYTTPVFIYSCQHLWARPARH